LKDLKDLSTLQIKGISDLKVKTAQIIQTTKEISEFEKKNNSNAKLLLESFGNEIQKIGAMKTVHKAYGNYSESNTPSFYFDKKK
jgi:hypothetical protein